MEAALTVPSARSSHSRSRVAIWCAIGDADRDSRNAVVACAVTETSRTLSS